MGFDDFLPTSPKKDDEPAAQEPTETPEDSEEIRPALPSSAPPEEGLSDVEEDSSPEFEASVQFDPEIAPDIILSESASQETEEPALEPEPEVADLTAEEPAEFEAIGDFEPTLDDDSTAFIDANAIRDTDPFGVDLERLPAADASAAEQTEAASELASELAFELSQEQEASDWVGDDFAAEPADEGIAAIDEPEGSEDLYDFEGASDDGTQSDESEQADAAAPAQAAGDEPPEQPEQEPAATPAVEAGASALQSEPSDAGDALATDDLFDFDRPLDQIPDPVIAARAAEEEQEEEAEPQAAKRPEQPLAAPVEAEKALQPVAPPATSSGTSKRSLQVVGAALGMMLLLNMAVLFTTWRSQSMAHSYVTEMGNQMLATTERMRVEGDRRAQSLREVAQLMAEPREHGYEILDAIDHDIQKGEYQRARRSLHALIAVGDSLDPSVRDDILARASFRIGDTYRREAGVAAAMEEQQP